MTGSSITSRTSNLGPPSNSNTSKLTTLIGTPKRARVHAFQSGVDSGAHEQHGDFPFLTLPGQLLLHSLRQASSSLKSLRELLVEFIPVSRARRGE